MKHLNQLLNDLILNYCAGVVRATGWGETQWRTCFDLCQQARPADGGSGLWDRRGPEPAHHSGPHVANPILLRSYRRGSSSEFISLHYLFICFHLNEIYEENLQIASRQMIMYFIAPWNHIWHFYTMYFLHSGWHELGLQECYCKEEVVAPSVHRSRECEKLCGLCRFFTSLLKGYEPRCQLEMFGGCFWPWPIGATKALTILPLIRSHCAIACCSL